MSERSLATVAPKPALNPASGLLQRKCDCGQHTVAGGVCVECSKEKTLFEAHASPGRQHRAPTTTQNLLNSPVRHPDLAARSHLWDFIQIPTFSANQVTRSSTQCKLRRFQDAHPQFPVGNVIVEGHREAEEEQPPAPETTKTVRLPSQSQTSRIGFTTKPASVVAYWGDTRSPQRPVGGQFPNASLVGSRPHPVSWAALQVLPKDRGAQISGPPVGKDLATVWGGGGKGVGGYTDWPAGYNAPDFEFNTTATGADWFSRPTAKTAAFEGTSGSFYTATGKYKTGDVEGGKDVYWSFSPVISNLIKTGEQEHCDDYAEAYRISLKEADTILNTHIVGKTFGPKASKADAEGLVLAEITAKLNHPALGNDKTQWATKYNTLYSKTLIRDTSRWHTISLGSRSVDKAGNVIYEVVKGTSKIPGPPSSTIIKY